jgi:uncharacterized protein YndB with AHSA1/START domain
MTPMTEGQTAVRLQRVISATPDRVYRAWLDPDLVAQWLAPGNRPPSRVEVDERVGGHYRIWHAGPDGDDAGGFECELLELVPDQRIVFRWGFVGPARLDGPAYDSVLTVTLADAPGDTTTLTLVHERLESLQAAMPHAAENVRPGWEMALDHLETALSRT